MCGACKGLLNRSQGFALPLPGLHLKSGGSGFRAVHQSRELRSQRRFTGSSARILAMPNRVTGARKFCSTDKNRRGTKCRAMN
jgi:hypothetical protein